jgi:hypothetical protein
MTLLLFVLVNGFLQLDRRYFDLWSQDSSYPALPHVDVCESLGRAPDVLYIGSSLALHGISPSIVDSTVHQSTGHTSVGCNAGVDDASMVTSYFVLRRMIEDGYIPRMVVDVINENWLTSDQGDAQEAVNAHWLAGVQDMALLPPTFGTARKNWLGAVLERADFYGSKLLPLYGDRIGLAASFNDTVAKAVCKRQPADNPCHARYTPGPYVESNGQVIQPADRQGWVALTGTSLATSGPQVVATYFPPCSAPCPTWIVNQHSYQVAYLNMTIALARANHIAIALVISPRAPVFFPHTYGTNANWASVPAFYQSLADRYGVPFYDASHASGYTDADFADSWHLTAEGAAIFSVWLGNHVIVPLATKQPT